MLATMGMRVVRRARSEPLEEQYESWFKLNPSVGQFLEAFAMRQV